MRPLLLTLLLAALTACGSSAGSTSSASPSLTLTPAPSPADLSLAQVCDRIVPALPRFNTPSQRDVVRLSQLFINLSAKADPDAARAIQSLRSAIAKAGQAYSDTSDPLPKLTASEAFDRPASKFAQRCGRVS